MNWSRLTGITVALGCVLSVPASSQAVRSDGIASAYPSRPELQQLIGRLEQAAQSPAYSPVLRGRAQAEAAALRLRLDQGDFQVGDRIALLVEGQEALSDTFMVDQGVVLRLPLIGEVPLVGVMRSELSQHLAEQLGRFVRAPQIRARSLIPISITGAVGAPGFLTVPGELPLTQVIMLAGGPGPNARVSDIRIERGDRVLLGESEIRAATVAGRTLDQLNIRAGDRIVVPAGGTSRPEVMLRTLTLLTSVTASIFALTRIF